MGRVSSYFRHSRWHLGDVGQEHWMGKHLATSAQSGNTGGTGVGALSMWLRPFIFCSTKIFEVEMFFRVVQLFSVRVQTLGCSCYSPSLHNFSIIYRCGQVIV